MEMFRKYITAKNIIFFVITILFLLLLTQIKDVAILFFASFVIACSLKPLVDKLSKKVSRGLASAIVLGGAILLICMFFVPLLVLGAYQIKSFLVLFPEHFAEAKAFILGLPFINATELSKIHYSDIMSSASGITTDLVNKSILISKGVVSAFIYVLAACLIIFYFMADEELVKKTYLSLFPKNLQKRADEILDSISKKVGGYVIALIATMVSVGLMVTIGLLILGIDYAVLLGLISGLFDIVPVVGPTVAFIVIMIAVCKMGLVKILLVAFVFLLAQWAENNLIRPYIFGKFLDLHPLIIYFFLLVTAQYLGVIGVVFAPAIAATVCVLIEELYIKNIK